MNKLKLKINLSALDKSRIQERTFTNKQGEQVTVREYDMEVFELKEEKILKEGPTWELVKTHMVTTAKQKGEEGNSTIIGSGTQLRDKNNMNVVKPDPIEYPDEEMNFDDMPF